MGERNEDAERTGRKLARAESERQAWCVAFREGRAEAFTVIGGFVVLFLLGWCAVLHK